MKELLPWIIADLIAFAFLSPRCSVNTGSDDRAEAESFEGLTILAGSELKDLEFLHAEMEQAAGTRIRWQYSGTLDMVDAVNAPEPAADLVWAASGKYLSLAAPGKVKASEKIMLSPVILGVKQSAARKLGWVDKSPTWGEVAAAVKAGAFRYGMTNPTASNSGFCAVVGVAAALSGKTDGLAPQDIPTEKLRDFFSGQKLAAGSSGWLADAYVKDPAALDGLINYESLILSLNQGGQLAEPLVPVYPSEGIITSDYPLMLVNAEARAAFDQLVAFLKTDAVQQRLMRDTHRRPVVATVQPEAKFGSALLVELPFPGSLDTLDALLLAYQDDLRRPGHAFFVIDTSGSMSGDRIQALREGLATLTGGEDGSRLDRLLAAAKPAVSEATFQKLQSLCEHALALFGKLESVALTDEDRYTLRETVARYLPETISNYLKLPPLYRRYHAVRDGKTAEMLLAEQLATLDAGLADMMGRVFRADTQDLLTQGRFLEGKFARPDLLTIPAASEKRP